MRWLVTEKFNKLIAPYVNQVKKVAVVGGSSLEPELKFIVEHLPSVEINFLGVESATESEFFTYLDLNIEQDNPRMRYDLVLCSQVLEHVWDVKVAIQNLVNLTNDDGYIWIACPASNYAHGSPDFYSAGYQPELICKLLELRGVQVIHKELLGSKRNYFMTHAIQIWPSRYEHQFPLAAGFSRYFLNQIFGRFFAIFKSPIVQSTSKYATETFVLARKLSRS